MSLLCSKWIPHLPMWWCFISESRFRKSDGFLMVWIFDSIMCSKWAHMYYNTTFLFNASLPESALRDTYGVFWLWSTAYGVIRRQLEDLIRFQHSTPDFLTWSYFSYTVCVILHQKKAAVSPRPCRLRWIIFLLLMFWFSFDLSGGSRA